ncbi:acyltransferase family protein [Sphingobium sp. AP49]|uniref:acyltransferase family protein n=1 Tax=Sphingobium sp. AP49 TaxID=1144307 RepID=UPI00026EDCE1|nr:acyltransferase family protein [Sphingobium sp. AP49]WHO39193.1 acyltransferase family protein [Sphingobium sp. AP49]
MAKNPSIDLLKGLLILLVMGGHAMELTHQQHLLLWIGAGFRMPLMIGISGYLLNVTRTRTAPFDDLMTRYGRRMLLPWGVAMLIYVLASGVQFSWELPLDMLLRPPFHLWYVPALFLLILLTRLVPLSPLLLLAIGTPVSLVTMYAFGLDHGPVGGGLLAPDSRFLRYPVYFFFGMLVAERSMPKRYLGIILLVGALGLFWWSDLYGTGDALGFVPARLLMCLALIALLPSLAATRFHFAPINRIGRDSLFFYLWHPLVMGLLAIVDPHGGVILCGALVLLYLASMAASRSALSQILLGIAPRRPPVAVPPPDILSATA